MEQVYYIEGMTCGNCQKSVQNKLTAVESITAATVDLASGKATISTSTTLDKHHIEKIIGPKYAVLTEENSKKGTKIKALYPLFLILTYVVLGAFFLNRTNGSPKNFMMYYMGLFFIVFSFFKFLDFKNFPASFAQYDPFAKRSRLYGFLYPFMETLLGLAFLFQWQVKWALWITLITLGATSVGVLKSLVQKRQIACACLGTALKLPMTEATLIENSIMIVMSICMLLMGSL